ncbi:MAG: hypothetical protein JXR96_18215 [Deltaproteobacteria bacterium]|nr:hypothetical protein [Deltaproteobacteria bacterium]
MGRLLFMAEEPVFRRNVWANGWLASALLLCLGSIALAAKPAYDPGPETVLLGAARAPETLASRGRWRVEPGSISLEGGERGFWLAGGAGAHFGHGVLRARFKVDTSPRIDLLLRARSSRSGGRIQQALGLRVRGKFAWLIGTQRGRSIQLSKKVLLADLQGGDLEILASALGPVLVSELVEAGTARPLASTSAVWPAAAGWEGAVGLADVSGGSLLELATRQACDRSPGFQDLGMPIAAFVRAGFEAPAGQAIELERLGGPARRVLRTDLFGLERLACQAADRSPFVRVLTTLPWKYRDLDYLQRRGGEPARDEQGFALARHYKDPRMVEAILRGLARAHPKDCLLERIGRSHQGRPIWALAIGRGLAAGGKALQRPAVLLNGAHHGDEIVSVDVVLDAAQHLLAHEGDPRVRRWLDELVVWAVPLVNPDGLAFFMEQSSAAGRKNGRDLDGDGKRGPEEGVDLNRNYPFRWDALPKLARQSLRHHRGPSPGSEPETRAMMALARREHFAASISYHMGCVSVLVPYTIEGVPQPEPDEAWAVAEQITAGLKHPQGKLGLRRQLFPVSGTDQDWLRYRFGTLALLVEAATWPPPLETAERVELLEALRLVWMRLLDRLLDGPAVSGTVRDRKGRPQKARVRVLEIERRAGERWTSRPRDGHFDRFLPAPGSYTLEIRPRRGKPHIEPIQVGRERVKVEIVLPDR